MDRRKELKQQYKELKPPMGIMAVKSSVTNKIFLETSTNVDSRVNSTRFKLRAGGHPNRDLQKDWKDFGEAAFYFEVLQYLDYSDDEKTDYTDDLKLLKMIWQDRFAAESLEFY